MEYRRKISTLGTQDKPPIPDDAPVISALTPVNMLLVENIYQNFRLQFSLACYPSAVNSGVVSTPDISSVSKWLTKRVNSGKWGECDME